MKRRLMNGARTAWLCLRALYAYALVSCQSILPILFGGLFLAIAPASATAVQLHPVLYVQNDPGGSLSDRVAEIERIRSTGTHVEITVGFCNSACTMYLGLPNTCVAPSVSFGFHGPMSQFYGIPLSQKEFDHWSHVMASYYPEPLRSWFLQEARFTTIGIEKISGRSLIEMGIPACS